LPSEHPAHQLLVKYIDSPKLS
ncbi:hypothetical protein ACOI3T_29945, partial [Acinetobacter baumannii]